MNALTTEELLRFCSEEHRRWRQWFQKNPQALDLTTDIAKAKNVRELVKHIVIVELRYSERLLGMQVTEYDQVSSNDLLQLFAIADRAEKNFRAFINKAKKTDWQEVLTFPTRSAGTLSASKRKIFVHALLHGMRHWAQLATFLRQQGFEQDWQHDFIFSTIMN